MDILQAFFIATVFSFLGSIPPGALNLTVIQIGLKGDRNGAIRFAVGAVIFEFVYATIAVGVQYFFVSQIDYTLYFKIIAALALLVLGVINILNKPNNKVAKDIEKGIPKFKQGMLISAFNLLPIPYWLVITAYLESQEWVVINKQTFWFYILGITMGAFILLAGLGIAASKSNIPIKNNQLINKITGLIFVGLSIYMFVELFL